MGAKEERCLGYPWITPEIGCDPEPAYIIPSRIMARALLIAFQAGEVFCREVEKFWKSGQDFALISLTQRELVFVINRENDVARKGQLVQLIGLIPRPLSSAGLHRAS